MDEDAATRDESEAVEEVSTGSPSSAGFGQREPVLTRSDRGEGCGHLPAGAPGPVANRHVAEGDPAGNGQRSALRPFGSAPSPSPAEEATEVRRRRRERAARPARLLIIEDRDDTRRALCELLRLVGHEVETAADGEAGLAALLEQAPDIAIIDIDLPGIDGYTVAREARRQASRDVALVAVTARGSVADRELAMAAGFDRHVAKPVPAAELFEILDELSSGRSV